MNLNENYSVMLSWASNHNQDGHVFVIRLRSMNLNEIEVKNAIRQILTCDAVNIIITDVGYFGIRYPSGAIHVEWYGDEDACAWAKEVLDNYEQVRLD